MEVEVDENVSTEIENKETVNLIEAEKDVLKDAPENESDVKVKMDTKKTIKQKFEKPIEKPGKNSGEKPGELKEEKPKLKKVIKPKDKEIKNEDLKKQEESEKLPFRAKLRKTETIPRKIEKAKMETVQLKHHEFEVGPKETDVEQISSIILGEPLVSVDEDALEKMEESKVDKKRKIK